MNDGLDIGVAMVWFGIIIIGYVYIYFKRGR